jgi:hypothetical protein
VKLEAKHRRIVLLIYYSSFICFIFKISQFRQVSKSLVYKNKLLGKTAQKGKIRENFRLGTGTQTSYQRSWKKEKRNIRKSSCLRTVTLTDSKGFCENSLLGKGISGKTSGFIRETYSRI